MFSLHIHKIPVNQIITYKLRIKQNNLEALEIKKLFHFYQNFMQFRKILYLFSKFFPIFHFIVNYFLKVFLIYSQQLKHHSTLNHLQNHPFRLHF